MYFEICRHSTARPRITSKERSGIITKGQKPWVRFKSFLYQGASWTMTRPVVAKVEFHYGKLFPSGFIVTNLGTTSREVVKPCKGKPFDVTNQLELKGQGNLV